MDIGLLTDRGCKSRRIHQALDGRRERNSLLRSQRRETLADRRVLLGARLLDALGSQESPERAIREKVELVAQALCSKCVGEGRRGWRPAGLDG